MEAGMTLGQRVRLRREAWESPIVAEATAPVIAASAPISQLHIVEVQAMQIAHDGHETLALRVAVLYESHDGAPLKRATVRVQAPGARFADTPGATALVHGDDEGWQWGLDAPGGVAGFLYEGTLGHGGSAGFAARVGLEGGARLAGTELVVSAVVHDDDMSAAATTRRLVIA